MCISSSSLRASSNLATFVAVTTDPTAIRLQARSPVSRLHGRRGVEGHTSCVENVAPTIRTPLPTRHFNWGQQTAPISEFEEYAWVLPWWLGAGQRASPLPHRRRCEPWVEQGGGRRRQLGGLRCREPPNPNTRVVSSCLGMV